VNGSAAAVAAAIRERTTFLLTSHARPDGDAIGSSVALALALDALGKRARVVLHDPIPPAYAGFPSVDRIEYASEVHDAADAAILLECSDPGRPEVGGLAGRFLINVDHHVGNTMYGAVNWFEADAAACGEMVADIIDALGVAWTREIASHLYLALSTDTGSFRYGPISAHTFDICRRIADTGVQTTALSRQIFDSFSVGRVRITGTMLDRMELHHNNRLAVLTFDDALLERSGATIDDTEGLVNLPLGAREIVAVALLKQQQPGVFRVSLRSKGAVNVRHVVSKWGGGGHVNAAGCTVAGTFEAVRDAIVSALGTAIDSVA
jgi:phosphoesterase RecJ-like protein